MPFKIKYRFNEESEYYDCVMTYSQFHNFRSLPIIAECQIVDKDSVSSHEKLEEMQEALNMAFKNDTSHIKRLSNPEQYA